MIIHLEIHPPPPTLLGLEGVRAEFTNFSKHREANLADIIFKTFGKTFGTAVLFLYLIWQMIPLGILVRNFAEKFLTSVLPNTPMNFFTVTILAVVFYAMRGGIVYIARTAEILFIFTIPIRNLGIIYIGISVIHTFFRFPIFKGSTMLNLLYSVSLPFTFLYAGFFLRTRQMRGNNFGY